MYLTRKTEPRASHHRAGDLSAGTQELTLERNFSRVRRKAGNDQERVGGVQANAHDVDREASNNSREETHAQVKGPYQTLMRRPVSAQN